MSHGTVLAAWKLTAEALPTTSSRVSRLQMPSGCFYLKESASTESVQRELDLLEHLASVGLAVPRYIATAAGQRYTVAEGRAYWLSRELPGHHFAQFHGPAGLEQVARLATQLGELHRAFLRAPNLQGFPVFRDSGENLLATLLAHATPYDVGRLQQLRGKVAPVAVLPKQLIHRDFHRRNVLFADELVSGFLDFDLVHEGPRLFDVCYCASGVLSESFYESGYPQYWLTILETIFRAYERIADFSAQERSLAWSMLMTIELIFLKSCLERQDLDAARLNQDMLFWFEDHQSEIEGAIARCR